MALPPVAGVNWATPTVIAGLVLADLLGSVTSLAVRVKLPFVPKKTANDCVPAASAAFDGNKAVESVEVIPTVSVTELTTFQFASTALAVTLKPVLAVWAFGAPVLPRAEPGDAVSPGTSNWSFTKAPTLTVTLALVLAVSVAAASVAVMVRVPAVLNVKLDRVRVPETNVRLPAVTPLSSAIVALASEVVMVTLGVAPLTTFQLASTALTTIPLVIAVPAV